MNIACESGDEKRSSSNNVEIIIEASALQSSNKNNMSSFMSGLLAERAVQFEFPRSDWSIFIVDDNARPKHNASRRMKLMHERQTQSCRDLRWGGERTIEENPPTEKPSPSAAPTRGIIPSSFPSKSYHRRTLKRSSGSSIDFRKNTGGNVRFETGTMRTLRRSANSDTMLLKMPVRTISPNMCRRPSLGGLTRANAEWGISNRPSTNTLLLAAGLPKLPRTEIGNSSDDYTTITSPMGDDSLTQSSLSDASTLSRMSDMSHSSESLLQRSSYSSLSMGSTFTMGSNKSNRNRVTNKQLKKKNSSANLSSGASITKKGKKSSSLESSLKKRASMLGLDLN